MPDEDVFVFEVSKNNFNAAVITNSYKLPVVVEFMGVWSEPCIEMSDHLAKLAAEFSGQFIFAKIDVDEQPELMKEYSVKNIPTLKIFKNGEVVQTEEGQLKETELYELVKFHGVYNASDELRDLARKKHINGDTAAAIDLLTKAIQQDPGNIRVAMDMVQIFLDINELEPARDLFNRLPEQERLSGMGKSLLGQLVFKDMAAKTLGKDQLQIKLTANADDFDSRFDLATCLVAEHEYTQAMDNLFIIFEKNPEYKDGAAKEMIISLTNMLSENEPALAQQFRRRMANAIS